MVHPPSRTQHSAGPADHLSMNPIAHHIICRLADSRVIAPTASERRLVARVVLEKCRGRQLLAFNVVDTHLHGEIAESRACCGELVRRIELALHPALRLDVGFGEPEIQPVKDQRHLRNAFDYILRQGDHHGLDWDPCWEASNLPDLLGARILGIYTARSVRQHLPRVRREELLAYLGISRLEESDGPLEEVVPAALAAAGLAELHPRSVEGLQLARAIVEVVGDRMPVGRLADLLEVNRSSLFRFRRRPVDHVLVRAVRLQLALRRARPSAR